MIRIDLYRLCLIQEKEKQSPVSRLPVEMQSDIFLLPFA